MTSPRSLTPLDEIEQRLDQALSQSVADFALITWVEEASTRVETGSPETVASSLRSEIWIEVLEGRRRGLWRQTSGSVADLASGLRSAASCSTPNSSLPPGWSNRRKKKDTKRTYNDSPTDVWWDDDLACLTPEAARQMIAGELQDDERAEFEWGTAQVVVAASNGFLRRAALTLGGLEVFRGTGPGAGWAAGWSRSFAGMLDLDVAGRARRRHRTGELGQWVDEPVPLVFSQEATAALVSVLNEVALSSRSFHDGTSPFRNLLGEHVFAPIFELIDDPINENGLPFAFDARGRRAKVQPMIEGGVPRTPAVDTALANQLALAETAQAVDFEESRASHLHLSGDGKPDEEVLAIAEGGLWVSRLEALTCDDPARLGVRGRATGVHRVRGGHLAEPMLDFSWQDSLLRVFSQIRAVGQRSVTLAEKGTFGGITTPIVAVEAAGGLQPIRP